MTQIREEEIKNKLARDYFSDFDCTRIIGNIDFCVTVSEIKSLFWAEAKKGHSDIYRSIVQLILTIGKARTFDKQLPPAFLGAFDAEKIAFIPYNAIQDIFYQNDFNWSVTPSNYETKEFRLVHEKVKDTIDQNALIFNYDRDNKELKSFIKDNFIAGKSAFSKIKIDKNNFISIYNKWLQIVKPTIVLNWDIAKKNGIIDGDFYLADLLSIENESIREKLSIYLKKNYYEVERGIDDLGLFRTSRTVFKDNQKAHTQFWNKYERPPKEEYWDYIVNRRDLLVPQDIRERKGSFFTPQIWVELSQKYLADVLGENWQDDYYIWDCAAGTGNLLTGLTNKYHIWASTLDKQDVDVMKDRIMNGANLLETHVFQFDFLNDDFSKLPQGLQEVINDNEKRKKLVIYINPPYAESGTGVGRSFKNKVALEHQTHHKYKDKLGKGGNELFIQFLTRIYFEIPECIIGEFSKLKTLQSSNFKNFRSFFYAKLEKCFVVPANSFDNVKGIFPIGFKIWNCNTKEKFEKIKADVFDSKGILFKKKIFYSYEKEKGKINDWLRSYFDKVSFPIGILHNNKNDFQHNTQVRITIKDIKDHTTPITHANLIQVCIYLSVRHCIDATWFNDRDQFLYPNKKWEKDKEFQNDCLTFALFHGQNRITSKEGINHWIPFTENEVNSPEKFKSNFMVQFINGKLKPSGNGDVFKKEKLQITPLEFSSEAQAVFEAGRELWKYYLSKPDCNENAALYDIREYFQGRNDKGKMNNKSEDQQYVVLMNALKESLKVLSRKIEPKIYEYGFLIQ